MAPQLKENFIADYPELGKFDLKALNPQFEETIFNLAKSVPEYGFWRDTFVDMQDRTENLITPATRRAIDQIISLFLYQEDGKLEAYSDKGIKNHIAAFIISVRARISQTNSSRRFAENMDKRRLSENGRINENRRLVLTDKKKLWYSDVTHRPIQSCSMEEFEAAPNNHAKKVQRIMTNETDRQIILDEKEAFTPEAIGSLIVDPSRLTDRQLENLGFTLPWSGKKRTTRLEKIEHISTLPREIKAALAALSPIGEGDPHDRFGRYRLFASLDGEVISTTNAPGRSTFSKASLLDAIRSKDHTTSSSLSETGKIAGVIRRILDADKQLQKGKWEQVKDTEQLSEAKKTLIKAFEALKNVRNPDKKEARELLEKAMTLESTFTRTIKHKDRPPETIVTVRLNPGAKRAQLEKAIRRLKTRQTHSIPRISRYVANDRQVLEAELAEHKNIPFANLEAYLDRHYRGPGPDDHKRLSLAQREGMALRLQEWLDRFDRPEGRKAWLEPYRSFVALISEDLNKTIDTVDDDESRVSDVKDHLAEIKATLRLKKIWDQWEELYDRHLSQDKLPIFKNFSKDLNTLSEQLIGTTGRGSLGFAFDAYCQNKGELTYLCHQGLEIWQQPDKETKARAIHLEMKRKMREVNIVDLLASKRKNDCEEEAVTELFGPPATTDENDENPPYEEDDDEDL